MPLEAIGATLSPAIAAWAGGRHDGEGLGDFCARLGAEATRALLGHARDAA